MRMFVTLVVPLLVAACASPPANPPPAQLFNDHLFAAPTERIDARDVLALSDPMQRYVAGALAAGSVAGSGSRGLVDALYDRGQLKLEYDSLRTRNAAEAFADRSGNCLSLVIMTAALARAMDLPVRFQQVVAGDTVSRSGNVHFHVSHVNLALGGRRGEAGFDRARGEELIVDFLPAPPGTAQRVTALREETIVAMYLNNRAAEALVGGSLDDAYWWARAAIVHEPRFLSATNTLGLVYQRAGFPVQAETAFDHALVHDPNNPHVLANQMRLLESRGRSAEAAVLAARLEALEPAAVFSQFDRGREAMQAGDFRRARDAFAIEAARAPYYHEFRYWLALAHAALGNADLARKEMAIALEYSTNRSEQELYAAKLARIKSTLLH